MEEIKNQLQVLKHKMQDGFFFPMQRYPKALDFKISGKVFFFLLLKHQLLATAKGMIPD